MSGNKVQNLDAIMKNWVEDFYNTPDDAAARQIAERVLSRGAVLHDIEIGPRDVVGIEGAIDYRTRMRRAFPDLKVRIDASTCSGDTFSCRYTCSGTHSGSGVGDPTGRVFHITGMCMDRVGDDGRIAEEWNSWDGLALLVALGYVPPLPTGPDMHIRLNPSICPTSPSGEMAKQHRRVMSSGQVIGAGGGGSSGTATSAASTTVTSGSSSAFGQQAGQTQPVQLGQPPSGRISLHQG